MVASDREPSVDCAAAVTREPRLREDEHADVEHKDGGEEDENPPLSRVTKESNRCASKREHDDHRRHLRERSAFIENATVTRDARAEMAAVVLRSVPREKGVARRLFKTDARGAVVRGQVQPPKVHTVAA